MATLSDFITEIATGKYGQDIVNYGKDSNGDFQPFNVDINGNQYVIDEQLATKLDTLIAKDFATETTLAALANTDFATETKLEDVRALLELVEGKDFATETKLEAVRILLNSLDEKDFSTETTLSAFKTAFENEDFATETKLEAVRVLINSLEGKDFATETTLDTRLSNLEAKMNTLLNSLDRTTNAINVQQNEEFLSKLETIAVNTKNSSGITNYDTLSYGDMDAGFFGIIPSSDFISGDELCAELGITQGTSQFSDTPWLKFAFKDKILITPMKPIRYGISWDHIYEAGAVYGDGLTAGESGAEHHNLTSSSGTDLTPTKQDASVNVNGLNYTVRLMRGAAEDPTNSWGDSDRGSRGPENEWNALILPLHERAKDGSWNYSKYVPTSVPDWGIHFSDGDLLTHRDFGNGSHKWMQESRDDNMSRRVRRGRYGASGLYAGASADTYSNRGFAPVLVRG